MNTKQKLIAKAYRNVRNLFSYKEFKNIVKGFDIKDLKSLNKECKCAQEILNIFKKSE